MKVSRKLWLGLLAGVAAVSMSSPPASSNSPATGSGEHSSSSWVMTIEAGCSRASTIVD